MEHLQNVWLKYDHSVAEIGFWKLSPHMVLYKEIWNLSIMVKVIFGRYPKIKKNIHWTGVLTVGEVALSKFHPHRTPYEWKWTYILKILEIVSPNENVLEHSLDESSCNIERYIQPIVLEITSLQ